MSNDSTNRSLPALAYNGAVINERSDMLSLTDMWKASGSPEARRPSDWLALSSTMQFRDAVEATLVAGKSGIQTKRGGRGIGGVTFGHWQIALAYAKYLDPAFHMWCNEVVRERMEGRPPTPALDARTVGGVTKGVIAKAIAEMMPAILTEALTVIVPALVREQIGARHHAVVDGVSAGQVMQMAGYEKRKGLRGVPVWISHRLRRFHASRGVAVHLANLGSSTAYVFDPLVAREWLSEGGKTELDQKVAERRGQGALRLV